MAADAPIAEITGSAAQVAAQIRKALKSGGSAEHAAGVQWFFKEKIQSHGWYTGDLRRAVRQLRREILRQRDFAFLMQVADELFSGSNLEESRRRFSAGRLRCTIWRPRVSPVRIVAGSHLQLGRS